MASRAMWGRNQMKDIPWFSMLGVVQKANNLLIKNWLVIEAITVSFGPMYLKEFKGII